MSNLLLKVCILGKQQRKRKQIMSKSQKDYILEWNYLLHFPFLIKINLYSGQIDFPCPLLLQLCLLNPSFVKSVIFYMNIFRRGSSPQFEGYFNFEKKIEKNLNSNMEYIDPSLLKDENGLIEEGDYDNGYEGEFFNLSSNVELLHRFAPSFY